MKWTIGTKIASAFILAFILLAAISFVSYRSTVALINAVELRNHAYQVINNLGHVYDLVQDAESAQRGYIVTGDDRYLDPYRTATQTMNENLDSLQNLLTEDPAQTGRVNLLIPAINDRMADLKKTIELRKDPKNGFDLASKEVITGQGNALMDKVRRQVDQIQSAEESLLRSRTEESQANAQNTLHTILIGGVLGLILLTSIGIALAKNISEPLTNIAAAAERIAAGDLTVDVPIGPREDEVGILARIFREMLQNLRSIAMQTRSATNNLNAASLNILTSSQQQAVSTSEQSAAVQETTATIEEISQTGSQISDKAKKVAASAEATSTASNAGLLAAQNTNQTMQAIQEQAEAVAENIVALSEKTQAVGEIIATVNDIAERSNLLALNASIEAAAAGEQGRSFTVVAHEMKNLADQAKQATVQVRSILGEIQNGINTSVMLTEEAVKRVESGKQQAGAAEQTIRQISQNVQESVQAFQQIVAATNQQQIGVEQVTQAMKNIKAASEQTAAGTSQLEKATANINALGQQLRKSVERYQI